MKEKVFLSYAMQDKAFAETIKDKLNELLPAQSSPYAVVDLTLDAGPGANLRRIVKAAIDDASTVVVVSSPNGDASGWVNYEAALADALGKDLVIVGRRGAEESALANRFADHARIIELED